MRSVKKILCAVDLLDNSRQVANAAITLGGALGAEIMVVHVATGMPHGVPTYEMSPVHVHMMESDSRALAQKSMGEFMAQNFQGVQAESWVAMGVPAEQILTLAQESGADMIVMGTVGRKGLPRLVFGSVAEEVVKSSPVPVLTVRSADEPRAE